MNKALQYALFLLKFRPRSEYELQQRLKIRGFSESTIKRVILFLKEKGIVNDLEFARIWVESRGKKPLGFKRLKQELRVKGIKNKLITRVLDDFREKYNEEETINDLVSRCWEKLKHMQPQKAKRRIFLYLLRRGFSSEIIQEAIEQICKQIHCGINS